MFVIGQQRVVIEVMMVKAETYIKMYLGRNHAAQNR